MPVKPLKPCCAPGCGALIRGARYCPKHEHLAKAEARRHDAQRESSAKRGYGHKWQKARAAYLLAHPLCAECERRGRVAAATDLDHIAPHKGDMKLFWDRSNWQGLCHSCHSTKTAREDGGFGNQQRRVP